MHFLQILLLAIIQGMAELLPVSSSAHVIVAERLMGLDPSTPEMTFLLVMLHTGTMFAVLLYFWPRWKRLNKAFFKSVILATAMTGVVGLGLKKVIEKVILEGLLGHSHGEVESLFKSLPLVAAALFAAGLVILWAASHEGGEKKQDTTEVALKPSLWIGMIQGLCLPFRGFSRSGATISTALMNGISRQTAEDFSFALAVVLTPPVLVLEFHRLLKGAGGSFTSPPHIEWMSLLGPGCVGMVFSFGAGLLALRWLSRWLEMGRWKYFGVYCMIASVIVLLLNYFWLAPTP